MAFINAFFSRKKCIKDKILKHSLYAYKNVILSKICALIALGTMVLLFFVLYFGSRPSFATLVFLIISVALIFRASEISSVAVIREMTKKLLKTAGTAYFIITVVFSFQWNYANLQQWESNLQDMINENKNVGFVALKETSMPHPAERRQLVEIINLYMSNSTEIWYGAHVIKMPYFFEGCYYNYIIPKYYELNKTIQ